MKPISKMLRYSALLTLLGMGCDSHGGWFQQGNRWRASRGRGREQRGRGQLGDRGCVDRRFGENLQPGRVEHIHLGRFVHAGQLRGRKGRYDHQRERRHLDRKEQFPHPAAAARPATNPRAQAAPARPAPASRGTEARPGRVARLTGELRREPARPTTPGRPTAPTHRLRLRGRIRHPGRTHQAVEGL